MITRRFPVDLSIGYPLAGKFNTDRIVFFDIETTGFIADTSFLYLIGCIYYDGTSMQMIQWFSEDIREETLLISSFFEFIKDYELIVHYNGSGFDIPYLARKCELFGLDYSFKDIQSLDIYKRISPIKKIFGLKSYKQKSIESFLNIDRKDTFSGGELITVYQSYLGKKRLENLKKSRPDSIDTMAAGSISEPDEMLDALLQHNEDDIKGLVRITPILFYADLFEKPFQIAQAAIDGGRLVIRLEYDFCLPVRISFDTGTIFMNAYDNTVQICINTYEGELKYFYDNYRDYYYLPDEDRAIHKSLAIYVDKDHRVKAKPSTCYTKRYGLFVPQYLPVIAPCFKQEYSDKLTFVEVHADFLLQEDNLRSYIQHILRYISASRLSSSS